MNESHTCHIPVLMNEVLRELDVQPGFKVVDGTLGGGGHTRRLAAQVGSDGLVVSLDRDVGALDRTEPTLEGLPVRLCHADFCDMPEVLDALEIDLVDSVLLDLGLSSDQLEDRSRGFSFSSDGPLDLRFDTSEGEPAWRLISRLSEKHLADLIYEFGEERYSRRIARAIVSRRREKPIESAADFAELVRRQIPRGREKSRIDPATRTFQALRIAVNGELKSLQIALKRLPDRIRPGGRLAIISFHSLEDRMVKLAFRDDDRLEPITRRPIVAGEEELDKNPRARSAKLRVALRREIDP